MKMKMIARRTFMARSAAVASKGAVSQPSPASTLRAVNKDPIMHATQYIPNYNADTLYQFAWEQFNSRVEELETIAKGIDRSKPWLKVAASTRKRARIHSRSLGLVRCGWIRRG